MSLIWEEIECDLIKQGRLIQKAIHLQRAKVPGGWLVQTTFLSGGGAFFYPDPEHLWDGSSLP